MFRWHELFHYLHSRWLDAHLVLLRQWPDFFAASTPGSDKHQLCTGPTNSSAKIVILLSSAYEWCEGALHT